MRILLIGYSGTIGKRLTPVLGSRHEIIRASRKDGDVQVDITSEDSIRTMYEKVKNVDACVSIAASGPLDRFDTLDEKQLQQDFKGKLFGQTNLVLIGQHYLNDGGCFTLTSGVFADIPYKGVTGGGMTSGALHSFVLSAGIELARDLRINVVSPGMVEDSAKDYGDLFPGLKAVSMEKIVAAYVRTIEEKITGQIIRVYE